MVKFINCSSIIFSSYLVILVIFITPHAACSADEPIHIEANSMTSTERTNSVVFIGDVDVKQGDVRIRSDEMTVYYTEADKNPDDAQQSSQKVEKLICIGNVEITRGEWLGTAKKMTYLSEERQVILTENAKAWQNQNMVSGDKIIYYLDEGRSEVSGDSTIASGDDQKAGEKKPSRVNMTIRQ